MRCKKRNAHGSPILTLHTAAGSYPTVQLDGPTVADFPTVTFPVDPARMMKVPPFVEDPDTDQKGHLDLCLTLESEKHVRYWETVDAWALQYAIDHPELVFGKKTTRDKIVITHQPILKVREGERPRIRVRVYMSGPKFLFTEMKFLTPDRRDFIRGKQWRFMLDHLGEGRLHNQKALPEIDIRGAWSGQQGWGLSLDCKSIIFVPTELVPPAPCSLDALESFIVRKAREEDKAATPTSPTSSGAGALAE
jgi:hypothetical protein